jgi:3-hydroxyisobutyrate dehydrogenase-like beta-hydroxyacid dehydrogenase
MVTLGATAAATPNEAFVQDVVISMLADDKAVREVILDSGAMDSAKPGTIHVNMATISVAFAKELTSHHAERGVEYISAPVLGRTEVAAAGKLNILAAGPGAAVARVQPLFDVIGQRTWPFGHLPYRANVAKIAANFMIACTIETIAESVTMARKHGIAADELLGMLTNTLFSAPVYKTYGALIAQENYEPAAFRLALGLKDVRLALTAGEEVSCPMPFASILRDNMIDGIAHGDGDKDWAAVAKVAQRRSGLSG